MKMPNYTAYVHPVKVPIGICSSSSLSFKDISPAILAWVGCTWWHGRLNIVNKH